MAAPQLADLVLETSNAPGTGPIVLGGAPDGRQTFADAFPAGGAVYYYASDGQQTEWGVGTLTVGSPNTLARTTVLGNLFGTKTVLNFTQNITVWCEIPAVKSPALDEAGYLPLKNSPDFMQDVALGAKDADTRYAKITDPLVRSLIVPEFDYLIDKIAAHKSNGRLWFHYIDKDGKEQYPEAALASDLDAKQAAGNYAKTDSQNTFLGVQNFNEAIILADGIILQTIGGTGGVAVNRYTDKWGVATTDLNRVSDGANLSWFRLYQDGMLRTNKGDVAFTSELPFVDQNLRVQVWEATAAGDGALQAIPQAFRVLVAVQATQQGANGGSYGNNQVEIVDGGSFRLHNSGNSNSYCTAYGYF